MPTVQVRTAQELKAAFKLTSYEEDNIIEILDDIDLNQSPFYFMPNSNFFEISTTFPSKYYCNLIINGNGHTISNAYIYPSYSLFYIGSEVANLTLNDLKIEAITNDSRVLHIGYKKSFSINNCVFNVKCYTLANNATDYTDIYPIYLSSKEGNIQYFTNCIFNFYVASSGSSSHGILIYCSRPYSYTNSPKYYFEACIFKIRNFANNNLYLFGDRSVILDNCAIFYNYVGKNNSPSNLYIRYDNNGDPTKIQNTYFTSFGTATNSKPIIYVVSVSNADENPNKYILTSFYDSDKVNCKGYYYGGSWGWATLGAADNCYPLTTAQCKDPNKLSEIGYIFAEET